MEGLPVTNTQAYRAYSYIMKKLKAMNTAPDFYEAVVAQWLSERRKKIKLTKDMDSLLLGMGINIKKKYFFLSGKLRLPLTLGQT